MLLRSSSHKACYQIHRSGPKQAKTSCENTTDNRSQWNFAQKTNFYPTLLILHSYYSGLNISVVSALLCLHLWQPHLQQFLTISSHIRWNKKGECSATLEAKSAATIYFCFYKTTDVVEIWGLSCRPEISHLNTSTHCREHMALPPKREISEGPAGETKMFSSLCFPVISSYAAHPLTPCPFES